MTKYKLSIILDDSGDSLSWGGFDGSYINGHMYVRLFAQDEQEKITSETFAGNHRLPGQMSLKDKIFHGEEPDDGEIKDDKGRYLKAQPGSPTYDPRLINFEKTVELTQEQYMRASSVIGTLQSLSRIRRDDYTISGDNCVDFAQKIYEAAGFYTPVGALFSYSELTQGKLAGRYAYNKISDPTPRLINDKTITQLAEKCTLPLVDFINFADNTLTTHHF